VAGVVAPLHPWPSPGPSAACLSAATHLRAHHALSGRGRRSLLRHRIRIAHPRPWERGEACTAHLLLSGCGSRLALLLDQRRPGRHSCVAAATPTRAPYRYYPLCYYPLCCYLLLRRRQRPLHRRRRLRHRCRRELVAMDWAGYCHCLCHCHCLPPRPLCRPRTRRSLRPPPTRRCSDEGA
jgi:hypothetical protein